MGQLIKPIFVFSDIVLIIYFIVMNFGVFMNQRHEYELNGAAVSLTDISEQTGLNISTLYHRWHVQGLRESMWVAPLRGHHGAHKKNQSKKTVCVPWEGVYISLNELSRLTQIPFQTLEDRVADNLSGDALIGDARNYDVSFNEEILSLWTLSQREKIPAVTLYYRYHLGAEGEALVRQYRPGPRSSKRVFWGGAEYTLRDLSEIHNIHLNTLVRRYKSKGDANAIIPLSNQPCFTLYNEPITLFDLATQHQLPINEALQWFYEKIDGQALEEKLERRSRFSS